MSAHEQHITEQDLLAIFASTLSSSNEERQAAEARLVQVQATTPTCFVALIHIILNASYPLELRQAAAISLRPLILRKWSPFFEKFEGYGSAAAGAGGEALSIDIKNGVRQGLLQALICPERKIRLAASNALAAVASPDFPDQFPELLPFIKANLQQQHERGSVDAVHGTMIFLSDFVRSEMDENQLMSVAQEILPSLEALLMDKQEYSPHLRARSIMLFRQMLETLYMVKEQFPEAAKQAVDSLLPRWLQAMCALLGQDLEGVTERLAGAVGGQEGKEAEWESLALRHEALTTLNLAAHFKAHIKPHLSSIIITSLHNIQALLPAFHAFHVASATAGEDPFTKPSSFPPEGDADIASSIPKVISAAVELINTLVRVSGAQGRNILQSAERAGGVSLLGQFAWALLNMAQMSKDEEEEWTDDVNLFISEQEDEDMGGGMRSDSLRVVAIDTLSELLEILPPDAAAGALKRAFDEQVSSSKADQQNGGADWWKPIEAALACVGGSSSTLGELLDPESGSSSIRAIFNLESVFESTVIPYIAAGAPAFLRGQAFIFASNFSSLLPAHIARQFLEEAVKALETDVTDGEGMIVTISSVRAIKNLHRRSDQEAVRGYAERILGRIGLLLDHLQGDGIVLLLETIQSVVVQSHKDGAGVKEIADYVYGQITTVALNCYLKEPADIVLADVVQDLLEALAGRVSTSVGIVVLQAAIPQLVPLLVAGETTAATGKDFSAADSAAIANSALETLTAVLRGAPVSAIQSCNAPQMVLPNLFKAIQTSPDDRELLQSGVQGLTLLITKAPEQVLAWHDAASQSAWQLIMQVIGKLLDPSDTNENGGLVLGGLVLALLRKAGPQISGNLPELMQAMVVRLASAKTLSLAQSLILPIAHLMCEQCATVVQVLKQISVPSADGIAADDGLIIFARRWVEETTTIHGAWAKKANTIALSRFIESDEPVLSHLQVNGDLIPDNSGLIITRSKSKSRPEQYTQVSLGSKILKLLLEEWASSSDEGLSGSATVNIDDGDDDGDWDDDDEGPAQTNMLSDMLGFDLEELVTSEDFFTGLSQEELKNDPINNINVKSYVSKFLRQQMSANATAAFAGQLDSQTQATLEKAIRSAS